MNCPTTDELVAIAVGYPAVRGREHVAACPACTSRLNEIGATLVRLEAAHATRDRGHEAGRARLLAALAAEPPPARLTLLRRIVMDRRTWISSAAAAAAVAAAVFLGWGGTPSVALADALKPFREAKSFSCEMVPLQGGEPGPGTDKFSLRLTWASPGSLRMEIRADGKPHETVIVPNGKPGVVLQHWNKTHFPTAEKLGRQEEALLKLVNGLAAYSSGDQKPAGTDEIGKVKAPRFELTVADPEAKDVSWRANVWVHPETKRPLRVEFALQAGQDPRGKGVAALRLEKFEWDGKTDGLFDATPPAGYKSAAVGR
jgi:outer membrane lipoprotein-sorting protein